MKILSTNKDKVKFLVVCRNKLKLKLAFKTNNYENKFTIGSAADEILIK